MNRTSVRMLVRRGSIRSPREATSRRWHVRPLRRADISGTRTLSRQHRDPRLGRDAFPAYQGRSGIEAFLRRHLEHGTQMEVEDIPVSGPPQDTRTAARSTAGSPRRTAATSTPARPSSWSARRGDDPQPGRLRTH